VDKNERIGMKGREWVESDIFSRANILAQLTWESALPFLFFCSIVLTAPKIFIYVSAV
jgi:hypothetical protein